VLRSAPDFADAEPLLQRALEIRQAVFGPEHRDVAASLDNLAALKKSEHKSEEAAALTSTPSRSGEVLGPDSPDLAADLNNLGAIYELGKERQRASLCSCGRSLDEKALAPKALNWDGPE